MNNFPIHPRHEYEDTCSNEFDYQEDFIQFLEEAKKKACKWTSNTAHLQAAGKEQLDGEKKNKKSWGKISLFSWLKTHRKRKSTISGDTIAKPRAASGPLIGLFGSTKTVEEFEVPYMCLGKLNNTQKNHSYGPVYLVT